MQYIENLEWWQSLLLFILGIVLSGIVGILIGNIICGIIHSVRRSREKERKERQVEMQLKLLKHFRKTALEMTVAYDDRHGLTIEDKESAFHWFYNKYTLDEQLHMKGAYCLNEMYTEEELLKIGS